jgi:hypothetical protein
MRKAMNQNQRSANVAAILEAIPALFGLLGIGWIYAGQAGMGIGLMVGYWVFLFLNTLLVGVTGGIWCIPMIPLVLGGVGYSAYKVRERLLIDAAIPVRATRAPQLLEQAPPEYASRSAPSVRNQPIERGSARNAESVTMDDLEETSFKARRP